MRMSDPFQAPPAPPHCPALPGEGMAQAYLKHDALLLGALGLNCSDAISPFGIEATLLDFVGVREACPLIRLPRVLLLYAECSLCLPHYINLSE